MKNITRFIVLGCLIFAGLARADLLISNFGGAGSIRKVNETTGALIPPVPFISLSGGGGEGILCLTLEGRPVYYIANNTAKIGVYDQITGAYIRDFVDLGSGSIAALAFSPDGSITYAADWSGGRIVALSTTTGATLNSVTTTNSHDVTVGPDGTVYAAYFNSNTGVLKFSPTLAPLGTFIQAGDNNLTRPGGMTFNANGSRFYVSQFSSSSSFVNEYSVSGGNATFSRTFPLGAAGALGLAIGPDGNVYTANFSAQTIGKIDVTSGTVSTFVNAPDAGPLPKYLFFSGIACKDVANAFIEICKSSSITNPVSGTFTFTATNGAFTSPPISVPAGVCSGPVPVTAGTVKVTEAASPGSGVSAISAYGFNGTTSIIENRLVSSDLANRTATVSVPAGGIAAETIVEFTNSQIPTGVLEVCKDLSPSGTAAPFSFTVSGASGNPYLIPPGACSGPILVQAGSVTVTEQPRAGFALVGASTLPGDRLLSINIPTATAVVSVPPGDVSSETVVRFVNTPSGPQTGQLKICKVAGPGVLLGQLFSISANGVSYVVPAGPASQGGYCVVNGSYPVGTPVVVQESPSVPYRVLNMAVNPVSRMNGVPVLSNGNGQVTVTIGSGFTEVTVTNVGATPTGQLKICKIAGSGVTPGTNFSFNVSAGGTQTTYTVPAGPAQQGGYCIADGTFPLGTALVVSEVPASGFSLAGITVNGAPVGGGAPSANVTIGNGITEVAFTNRAGGGAGAGSLPFLNVVNYQLLQRQPAGGGRSYLTYRADLVNNGTALDSVVATAQSLDQSVEVVTGQGVLAFQPVPANSQITSSTTFTVAADGESLDFSKLHWSIEAKKAPARKRATR